LASIIEIDRKHLSNIEHGITKPGALLLVKLAGALECSPDAVLRDLGLM
jgi:transcriptional regulator with XRE-family HTH domain